MNTGTYVTKEKLEELAKELEELKTVKRKEIAQNLEYARSLGDLSENAEYQEAREMQATIESRIMILENTLKNAQVGEENHATGTVGMGSVVKVRRDGTGEQTFTIVGSEETNAYEGKVSNISPIGTALMGKKKGDSALVNTPKGQVEYKIVSIG